MEFVELNKKGFLNATFDVYPKTIFIGE